MKNYFKRLTDNLINKYNNIKDLIIFKKNLLLDWIILNKKWLYTIGIILIIFFAYIFFTIIAFGVFSFQNKKLINKVNFLEKQLQEEKTKRKVEITIISEKVDKLSSFLSRLYPSFEYSYKDKFKDALIDTNKIKDLPEDLLTIYTRERWLKPHGLLNYQKTLKDMIFPTREEAFVTSEYGTYRPYAYYNYQHEGIDILCPYDNSILAVYDAKVWKTYYDEGGGWTLEIKFEYIGHNGKKKWYFVRYRHLDEIYVKEGDLVSKGNVIAKMGQTGIFQTGKHLHFELWEWNKNLQQYININPVQNTTYNKKVVDMLVY